MQKNIYNNNNNNNNNNNGSMRIAFILLTTAYVPRQHPFEVFVKTTNKQTNKQTKDNRSRFRG